MMTRTGSTEDVNARNDRSMRCLDGKPDAFPSNDFSLLQGTSSASVPSSGSGKSTGRPRVITTPTAPCPTSDELDALCSSLDQGCKVARRAEGGFRLSASGPG
uniref:Uncharacterized protein n=1 Tax=Vespula pensylvanica TaxID=30213 RepID=A0A834U9Q8_VESPE|nr:hypothetical protein H0235_009053 [Vespula pensylvanica]